MSHTASTIIPRFLGSFMECSYSMGGLRRSRMRDAADELTLLLIVQRGLEREKRRAEQKAVNPHLIIQKRHGSALTHFTAAYVQAPRKTDLAGDFSYEPNWVPMWSQ